MRPGAAPPPNEVTKVTKVTRIAYLRERISNLKTKNNVMVTSTPPPKKR